MGCANRMEHIGNTKIKKSPHPETKTIRPVARMVTGPIDYQGFLSLWLGSWVHDPSTTNKYTIQKNIVRWNGMNVNPG